MYQPSTRAGRIGRILVAVVFAASVSFAPLSATALIDRGLGSAVEVIPETTSDVEQVVTGGGWYDATDYESADSLPVLSNVDTDESVELPEGAQFVGFTDAWAVWTDPDTGNVAYRDMSTGATGTLDVTVSSDAVISGDRLVLALPGDGDTVDDSIAAYDLSTGDEVSTPYTATSFAADLAADGDWAVWLEAVGDGDTPDGWDVKAWNVSTGDTVTLATDVQPAQDEESPNLQVSGGYAAWDASDGLHVCDLATGQDRVVSSAVDEFTLSGSDEGYYAVWTAKGVAGVDDVYSLDLTASGATAQAVTSTSVDESMLRGDLGWAVFQTPDPQGDSGVVTAVDLATGVDIQVSDPSDSTSSLVGMDGQRVSWTTSQGTDPDSGLDVSTLNARVLGLPAPELAAHYYSTGGSTVVNWAAVSAADSYEYTVDGGSVETTTATSIAVSGLDQGAVTVQVRSVRGSVTSDWAETVAVNAVTSKLSMSTKTSTVNLDATVSFAAKLTAAGAGLTDVPVYLESSPDGVNWSEVDGSEVTVSSSTGAVTLKASAARTLRYRAVFDGDDDHSGAVSSEVVVAARAVVGKPKFPSSVKKGHATSVSGVLRPDLVVHPSKSVTVYCYHHEGRKWVLRTRVTAVTSYDSATSTSSYAARISLTRTGAWRLSAVYKGSSVAAANTSGHRDVTVK
jgi:hypothetical protein